MYGFGQGVDDEPEQMPSPVAQYGTVSSNSQE
jgi:hypothetical protein